MSNQGANTTSTEASKNASKNVVEKATAAARTAIEGLLERERKLQPLCIRIAFYDAISYDPIAKVDGPNGSIRVWEGLAQEEEMKSAIASLDELKLKGTLDVWKYVSYADLYQLAGIVAVEKVGGPRIEFQYGRMDSCRPIPKEKLPAKVIPEDVKDTFHHLGFSDKEIVALSSAYSYWMNYDPTRSPTEQPSIFGTSYYEKLLNFSKQEASTTTTFHHWKFLLSDASFRKHVELFAKDATSFTTEYSSAHKKLSELGFKHFPEPLFTQAEYHSIKHGFAFAMAMTILFGFVGFFYEAMIRT